MVIPHQEIPSPGSCSSEEAEGTKLGVFFQWRKRNVLPTVLFLGNFCILRAGVRNTCVMLLDIVGLRACRQTCVCVYAHTEPLNDGIVFMNESFPL